MAAITPTPLKNKLINSLLLLIMIASVLFVLYTIIDIWPNKYGLGNPFWGYKLTIEKRIMLLVVLGGGLGAFIHTATSFTDFLGNRTLKYSWVPWYIMRPFIGSALAIIVYLLLRGGLFNPTFDNSSDYSNYTFETVNIDSLQQEFSNYVESLSTDTLLTTAKKDSLIFIKKTELTKIVQQNKEIPPVNPFGIMAIACMTGMFSRQAIDKLREIFESMFRVNKDVREDKLTDNTNTTGE